MALAETAFETRRAAAAENVARCGAGRAPYDDGALDAVTAQTGSNFAADN